MGARKLYVGASLATTTHAAAWVRGLRVGAANGNARHKCVTQLHCVKKKIPLNAPPAALSGEKKQQQKTWVRENFALVWR